MKLFYIRCPEGWDGQSDMDMFVWAVDGESALREYKKEFQADYHDLKITGVLEIPLTAPEKAQVVDWAGIPRLKL